MGSLPKQTDKKLKPLKPLKPLKTSKAAPAKAKAKRELTVVEEVEKGHLQVIADFEPITVVQFRERTHCPDAKQVLEGYESQGLAERSWQRSQGVYALTVAGRERLAELV
jgi:hypothetical protein